MLKNRIIPCLDVKNGRVVKGINFVDLKDAGDPVEQAKIYSDGGADEICFLDITASNENRDTIYDVVEKTSKKCFVPLTVGGGVRTVEDISKLLNCGADKVSINTAAVKNIDFVKEASKKFGSQHSARPAYPPGGAQCQPRCGAVGLIAIGNEPCARAYPPTFPRPNSGAHVARHAADFAGGGDGTGRVPNSVRYRIACWSG